jgi:hypothetical protein
MTKRGRPKIIELELTIENKQSILDYIKQGYSLKDTAKALGTSIKQVRNVYNRYIKDAEEVIELNRVDDEISRIMEMTISPRKNRIDKMHEMLNKTVEDIYNRNIDEKTNEIKPLDSGDFSMILKLLEKDESTLLASGRLQTTKKKNNDSRYFFNKEKQIKVDELNRQYRDTTEKDILEVENVLKDIEDE